MFAFLGVLFVSIFGLSACGLLTAHTVDTDAFTQVQQSQVQQRVVFEAHDEVSLDSQVFLSDGMLFVTPRIISNKPE